MSYRSLTRHPKRMLVFFEEDKTTCILPTNAVNKILGSNQALSDGAKVEVMYEKKLYEAQVLKLHDDPTVLSDIESQLELNVMHASRDENTRSAPNQESDAKAKARSTSKTAFKTAYVKRANVDEENIPPAKEQKLHSKSDKTTAKKNEKSKKHLKTKKIITIEAEESPADNDGQNPNKKTERKPGSMDFLPTDDQVRVQHLLDLCEQETADASTQTATLAVTALKELATVGSQTPSEFQLSRDVSCNCEEKVLKNQEEIKRMLNMILSRDRKTVNCLKSKFSTC